eukprot:TRINITY_DN51018_c0_g1_i1.p2 TRINITY_DN51018_c0_g1~~TRINITY_DN51018_c0_g1_i1.p2  ORF type:complete len:238 (+),score=77.56 TRINITY_DN51018_c0_g1_i1:84-716(+)
MALDELTAVACAALHHDGCAKLDSDEEEGCPRAEITPGVFVTGCTVTAMVPEEELRCMRRLQELTAYRLLLRALALRAPAGPDGPQFDDGAAGVLRSTEAALRISAARREAEMRHLPPRGSAPAAPPPGVGLSPDDASSEFGVKRRRRAPPSAEQRRRLCKAYPGQIAALQRHLEQETAPARQAHIQRILSEKTKAAERAAQPATDPVQG